MIIRFTKIGLGCCFATLTAVLTIGTQATAQSTTSIVALVNDEPISNHDINMRIKLYLANSKELRTRLQKKLRSESTKKKWRKMIDEYRPQNQTEANDLQKKLVSKIRAQVQASMKGKLKKRILKELVDERIQLQQANKLGVALTDEDLDTRLDSIAKRNKNKKTGKPLTRDQFTKSLRSMGIPIREFRSRMKAKSSWIRVVRRKFQYQINIGDQDVDRLIDTQTDAAVKMKTVYKIKRIRLSLASNASESNKSQRLVRADKLRQSITSCKQLEKAVGRVDGASLKSLGTKAGDTFPHTMRSYLSHTKDGHLTPATLTSSGVELYAVCERKQRRIADKTKRQAVKEKLRQQEFEILARRHLQDLRQDASIEYR
ncbi:MAG: hypothetical protein GY927_22320 [bacterium]|nr:hypothetical protein [bacterium]